MFIGHLPAGYLLARIIWPDTARTIMVATLVGSVIPDVDMLYFYLFDGRSTHHHDYITHRPIIWFAVFLTGAVLRRTAILAFGLGALLHMALDSIVGKITWVWPISDFSKPLVVVQATHDHWILSFLFHWTFLVEILIVLTAIIVAWRANFRST